MDKETDHSSHKIKASPLAAVSCAESDIDFAESGRECAKALSARIERAQQIYTLGSNLLFSHLLSSPTVGSVLHTPTNTSIPQTQGGGRSLPVNPYLQWHPARVSAVASRVCFCGGIPRVFLPYLA